MKKIDFGQALTVGANLAVVAGIALLAVELRQNNALLEIQSAGALVDLQIERDLLLLTDQSVSELLTKNRRGEILTDVEESRVSAFYAWNYRTLQKQYNLFRAGIVSEADLLQYLSGTRLAYGIQGSTFGVAQHWERNRGVYPADFQRLVDECIAATCSAIPR